MSEGKMGADIARISQTLLPGRSIREVLKIPQALAKRFAGKPTAPFLVAQTCGYSVNSSAWRSLNGAAVGYGLTVGAIQAKEMLLTPLGERVASPLNEEEGRLALKEAVLRPQMMGEFFHKFDCAQMPEKDVVYNFFASRGIPQKKLEKAYTVLRENAETAGFFRRIDGKNYLILNLPDADNSAPVQEEQSKPEVRTELSKVYLSHGKKNSLVVGQLRELLVFLGLQPVDSPERENSSLSLLDKVYEDMRRCKLGIIHLEAVDGSRMLKPDENLLVEIGAAIALYGKNLVLLYKKGSLLPANLKGLARCEYEGNQLDYTSILQLLQILRDLGAIHL